MTDLEALVDRRRGAVPCVVGLHRAAGEQFVARGEAADTPLFVGSVTKVFTATAVVRYAGLGRLDLDEPVPLLPDGPTPRQLLSHRSGLPSDHVIDGDPSLADYVDGLAVVPRRPEGFAYSNPGFAVLGRLLELASNQSFAKACTDQALAPWQLVRSGFPTPALRPADLPLHALPAGGLRATARELLRFGRGHLQDERLAEMQVPQGDAGGLADAMGLGWMIDDFCGTKVLRHGGHVCGRSAILAAVPSTGAVLAVLCGPEELAGHLFGDVMREVLGLVQGG